jgi:hypothetical protein
VDYSAEKNGFHSTSKNNLPRTELAIRRSLQKEPSSSQAMQAAS